MNHTRKIFYVALVFAITLSLSSLAQAQDSPLVIENMPNVFGVGLGVLPDYQGSDDYTGGGAPFGRLTFPGQQRYIQLLATEIFVNMIDHPFLQFGPVINYRFGRDDDVEDDVIKKMKEIDDTIEAGVIGRVEFVDRTNPRKRFIASVEFLHDIEDEHEGYIVALSARYWHPLSKAIDVAIGANASYADEDYMSTYFGVSPRDSVRTGLPVFEADGGIKDVSILPAAVVHLSMSWHLGLGVRYSHLLSDAKDSPVVDDRGSAEQFIAGLGIAYSW